MDKTCLITFWDEGAPKVSFRGSWIRKDVEVAYSAMFKELPRHIVARRKLIEEGESDERAGRESKERRKRAE